MRIRELRWTDWNIEHVARHGVDQSEVEELIGSGRYHMFRTRRERYAVVGQSDAGR